MSYYVGVDVGTSSARAALFTGRGELISKAVHPIQIHQPQANFFEQSSDDIWQACCTVVKSVCSTVDRTKVRGLSFDATCSMAVLDREYQPLSISPSGENCWNVVMWMDHRAEAEAEFINAKKHGVLKCVGGAISLEMQPPKLLWLKRNLREKCWDKAGHFMDLADFLTWKATGSLSRSLCTVACKWTYMADPSSLDGWSPSFFTEVGLEDLVAEGFTRIGINVQKPGEACGSGLSSEAAEDFSLNPGTPVGVGMIDAHAGALGSLACTAVVDGLPDSLPVTGRMALICGTSACHLAVSPEPLFVGGVWGPYYSALLPDMWLNEGGQSAMGKLIDHVIASHKAHPRLQQEAHEGNVHMHDKLNEILVSMKDKSRLSSINELTRHVHVWPDFHGNRSPLADGSLRGMVCGLTLGEGVEDLACLYLATLQGLAYGTQHILETMKESGHSIQVIHVCGGLAHNTLLMQTLADVTEKPLVLPECSDAVTLGAAMLAACASQDFTDMFDTMIKMGSAGKVIYPQNTEQQFHKKKYAVYMKMVADQKIYQGLMS